jgi:tetratricopeptide (TPR) repeat protein
MKFIQSDLDSALILYKDALELDSQNEYVHANIAAIHLKRSNYKECIEYSTKALQTIDYFMNDTKSFNRDNRLEVKLLQRRGKSYEMLGEFEKAKADLDHAVMLEP